MNGLAPDYLVQIFKSKDNQYNLRDDCRVVQSKLKVYNMAFTLFSIMVLSFGNELPRVI